MGLVVGLGVKQPVAPVKTLTPATATTVVKNAAAAVSAGATLSPTAQAVVRAAQTVAATGIVQPIPVAAQPAATALSAPRTTAAPTMTPVATSVIRPTTAPTPMLPVPTKPPMVAMPSPAQNEIIVSAITTPTSSSVKGSAGLITPPALPTNTGIVGPALQVGGAQVALPSMGPAAPAQVSLSPVPVKINPVNLPTSRPVIQVGTITRDHSSRPPIQVGTITRAPIQVGTVTQSATAKVAAPEVASSPVKKALVFGVPAALLLWAVL